MYDTIEVAYEHYLVVCEKHIDWLKKRNTTILKRCLSAFRDPNQNENYAWVEQLQAMEIVLGLSEEEKQKHSLKK